MVRPVKSLTPAEAAEILERFKQIDKYTTSFHEFVKDAFSYVTPDGKPFKDSNYVEILCDHLQAMQERNLRDLVVNIPPGTGKTRICSILWPVWLWIKNPKEGILFASYSQDLGIDWGGFILKLLKSKWFLEHFDIKVRKATPSDIQLEDGGWFRVTTPGGEATGRHPTVVILDDLVKAEDSTKKQCDNVRHWLENTIVSRQDLFSDSKILHLCVMQRLSMSDPAQYLVDEQKYGSLVLPYHYVPGRATSRTLLNGYEIPCDWREKKGELLTDNQSIAEIVKKASPYVYCSQYQQEPTGEGDRAFQPEWLMHRFEHAPKPHEGLWCISVDTAQRTREENDFTVMQVWCKFNARLYLVEQIRGHWDFDEICKQLIALAAKYPQARAKLVEGRANGDAVITHLGKTMMGIETIDPEGGKESRAAAVGPYFAAGNVLVASSEWTTEWVKELGVFPRGKHDDQVDATTQAIVWLADRAKLASIDPDVALALAGLYKILGDDMPPLESGYRAWRVSRSLPR